MTTTYLTGAAVARRINGAFPRTVIAQDADSVTVPAERIADVAMFMRDDEELDCKYLNTLLGVDWLDHFDVVYVISSLAKNHTFTLKARVKHEEPVVPSVHEVWLGANLQEREVYDLMGISFSNHPNMKRIFLWEGFPGHPLRKDFLTLPGGYKPGLQRFPFEFPEGQRAYPETSDTLDPTAPAVPRLGQPVPDMTAAQTGVEATEPAGGQLGVRGGGVHGTRSPVEAQPVGDAPPPESVTEAAGGEEEAARRGEPSQEPRSEADAGEPAGGESGGEPT